MKKKFDVYGIGNALVDLQVQATDRDLELFDLTKAGMKLVDDAEQRKLLDHFGSSKVHHASGGSAANTIIALSQLHAKTAYGCVVGDDSYGDFYHEEMALLGITLPNKAHSGGVTGTCVILITPDAERTMNTNLGVSATFSEAHIDEETLRNSSWLYIEGYLFSTPSGQAAVKKAVALAKQHGVKIAVTFSDAFIVNCFGDLLAEVVESSDLIFANEEEASAFSARVDSKINETSSKDDVFAALKSLVPNAIMTLGEQGALVSFGGEQFQQASFPAKACDLTGAGDMFAGAFLAGHAAGLDVHETARLSCFLASKVVSQLGPRLLCNVGDLVREEGFALETVNA